MMTGLTGGGEQTPSRTFRMVELVLVFLCIPGTIIAMRAASMMFYFLWCASLYAGLVLWFRHRERFRKEWNWAAVDWANMKPLLLRWVLACIGMALFLWLYDPDKFFALAREKPQVVPFLLVLYPVISALPQELLWCSFFFTRYECLFGSGWKLVGASAVFFAFAHVLYINPVAPTLSLLGGLIFASTYAKTRSLALVTIEHGLYGNFLFVIGLGWYFYGGNVGA